MHGGLADAVPCCRRSPPALLPACPPAGTLQRDFKHLAVDMFLTEEEGSKVLKVDCHFGRRKALASIRTCTSHVQVRTRPAAARRWPGVCRGQPACAIGSRCCIDSRSLAGSGSQQHA